MVAWYTRMTQNHVIPYKWLHYFNIYSSPLFFLLDIFATEFILTVLHVPHYINRQLLLVHNNSKITTKDNTVYTYAICKSF